MTGIPVLMAVVMLILIAVSFRSLRMSPQKRLERVNRRRRPRLMASSATHYRKRIILALVAIFILGALVTAPLLFVNDNDDYGKKGALQLILMFAILFIGLSIVGVINYKRMLKCPRFPGHLE